MTMLPATTFALQTLDTTYAMAVDDTGLLRAVHWGGRVDSVEDLVPAALWDQSTNDMVADIAAEEYPGQGGFRYKEASLAVTGSDGSRQLVLQYAGTVPSPEPGTASDRPGAGAGSRVALQLVDAVAGIEVDLHYRALPEFDLVERWAVIRNRSEQPVWLDRAFSAQFHIPFADLILHHTHGQWAAELQPFRQQLSFGKVVLERRKGVSDHHHNPSFVLAHPDTTETHGRVWFGVLRWSGNTKAVIEQRQYGGTSVSIGLNDHDLRLPLAPGAEFTTPAVVAGYTDEGLGGMSHRMHAFGRSLMRPGPRPVLYNSWEATSFAVTTDNQTALAQRAARVGAELFVVDDGWFGRRGEPADGLGDWWVNPDKFPAGLQPLIDRVQALGMDFGIWVEPEMVNPNSDLYAAHPDWIHRDPAREPDTARDQYVLNLALPQVRDFIVEMVSGLLAEHDIAYVKWDANRPMSQVADQSVWVRHIEGLYEVVARIKASHPDVLIEACASGGGRVDYGALSAFDDFWPSDNTDALDRLTIQRSYSLLYPIKAMRAWVTDSPNFLTQRAIPLSFRCHVAMMGTLGIGADLNAFPEEDLAETAKHVAQYRELRPTIQEGRFDRLENPSPNDYHLFQYTSDEQVALFAFLPASRIGRRGTRVRLRGLDRTATYSFTHQWTRQSKSGAFLMEHGIDVWLQGDYASELIVFDRV